MISAPQICDVSRRWRAWRLLIIAVLLLETVPFPPQIATAGPPPADSASESAGSQLPPVFALDADASLLPWLDTVPALDGWPSSGFDQAWPPAPAETAPALVPPAYHQRILLVGECNIEGGLGPLLEQQLAKTPGVVVKRAGKRSTGLARPDYYNWPERIRQLKAEFKPDLIMAYWGDNDCQNCATPKGKGVAGWGSPEQWHAEYARRTAEVVALMQEGGCTAVIVGMPNMRPEKFRKGIARVNAALAEGCAKGNGVFIDAWQFNTDASGNYRAQVEVNGKTAALQGKDGIHFTSHGAKFMAARIHSELAARFQLGAPPAATAPEPVPAQAPALQQ